MRPSLPEALVDAGRDLALGSTCTGCGRPGRVLCAGCRTALPRSGRVAWPTPTPPGLVVPFAAGAYDGLLRALVLDHKEHGVLALAEPLGTVLAAVATSARHALGADDRPLVLVPVPSRRAVVRSRGHDPLLRVVRSAATTLRRQGTPAVVVRTLAPAGRVADQAGLSAGQRAANLSGSMRARRPPSVGDALVLVADDVLTTGATVREAQRALETAGVPVAGAVTVAATQRRGGRFAGPGSQTQILPRP